MKLINIGTVLTVLLSMLATTSCGSPRMATYEREKLIKEQPSEVRQKLTKKVFWLGMTRHQVNISMGDEPDLVSRIVNADGELEMWMYESYEWDLGLGSYWQPAYRFYFDGDKLVSWQEPMNESPGDEPKPKSAP